MLQYTAAQKKRRDICCRTGAEATMEQQASKPRRSSFVQQGENPLADCAAAAAGGAGGKAAAASFRIENLANAKPISPEELEDLLAALKAIDDNKARLAALEEQKRPYLFSANQLLQVLHVTESVKTKIAIAQQLGPRLTDPRNKTEILALFRFSDEKRQVEDVLKAREQFLSKSQFVPPSGRASAGGRVPAGRGRGRGGITGRGRGRGAPGATAAAAASASGEAEQSPPASPPPEAADESTSSAAAGREGESKIVTTASATPASSAAPPSAPTPARGLPRPPSIAKIFLPVETPEQVLLQPAPLSPVHAVTPPPSPHTGSGQQTIAYDIQTELNPAEDEVQQPQPSSQQDSKPTAVSEAPEPNGQAAGYEAVVLASLGLTAENVEQMSEVWEQQALSTPTEASASSGDNGVGVGLSGAANHEHDPDTEQRLSNALQSLGLTGRDADDMLEAWEVAALQHEAGSTPVVPNGNGSHP